MQGGLCVPGGPVTALCAGVPAETPESRVKGWEGVPRDAGRVSRSRAIPANPRSTLLDLVFKGKFPFSTPESRRAYVSLRVCTVTTLEKITPGSHGRRSGMERDSVTRSLWGTSALSPDGASHSEGANTGQAVWQQAGPLGKGPRATGDSEERPGPLTQTLVPATFSSLAGRGVGWEVRRGTGDRGHVCTVTASLAAGKTRPRGRRLEAARPDARPHEPALRQVPRQPHTNTSLVSSTPGTELLAPGENSASG